ncbi:hypothetical protein CSB45_06415 [candidate division KSB3 bacterium]|uniref:Uncharacterized protein n=1 Tax=candidate division KSB3 bacterium TaxID=2044937 RepID=A0A2G6E7V9_9BACT|nr:MAG: hypothetical protein CSB45_06415 [candidate division KSB3 bacterium]PIE30274.1 MAG: hypothetical protein CSA57_05130 [candidate division KSB3 bacterium]
MDLLEFKTLWSHRTEENTRLNRQDRLRYMVMSIKVLQAKSDFKRMIGSIKQLAEHPESERAIYYYLRADLWKFLDNFQYILILEDDNDQEKLEGLELLNELVDIIVQDEGLQRSCTTRLQKLCRQIRHLHRDSGVSGADQKRYQNLETQVNQLLQHLDPACCADKALFSRFVSEDEQHIVQKYRSFSVSRISIEKMGVLKIIELLHDYPVAELQRHRVTLENTLETLKTRTFYKADVAEARNQCAYSLIVLLEILKMHMGLPVLLSRIFELCTYVYFPGDSEALERELKAMSGRISEISQKKLWPLIEDILWKNSTYLSTLPGLRTVCPWCYRTDRKALLDLPRIREVMTKSFERLESAPTLQAPYEDAMKSCLSKMVVESLGLLVNLEPSPRFLKLHSEESKKIRQMRKACEKNVHISNDLERLLKKQYYTYKNHLRFLRDSLDYYQGPGSNETAGKNG